MKENLYTPNCIRTRSGLYVNVFEPKPEMVCEPIKWYQRLWWMWIVVTMAFCILMIQISNKIIYIK